MEQFQTVSGMLDLMQRPAFCVQDQTIVKVNTAAAPFLIETGTDVKSLLRTGAEEYVITARLLVACNGVGRNDFVGVADMRFGGRIGNRRGNIILFSHDLLLNGDGVLHL